MIYTAFCQDVDARGEVWVGTVDAPHTAAAIEAARGVCASDWGYEDASQIHVLGLAEGAVRICFWED